MCRVLRDNLETFPYKIQKRYDLTAVDKDVRWGMAFYQAWWTPMTRNSIFNRPFNHQNGRTWGTNGSIEGKRVNRRQYPLLMMVRDEVAITRKPSFVFVASEVKSTQGGALAIFWKSNCFRGHVNNSMVHFEPFNAKLRTVSQLRNDSILDSIPHSCFHQQRRVALAEPWFEPVRLFRKIHLKEKDPWFFSCLTQWSQS